MPVSGIPSYRTLGHIVLIHRNQVLPLLAGLPRQCPACKASPGWSTTKCMNRGKKWSEPTAEHRGTAWLTSEYELNECKACGHGLMILLDDKERVRYEVHTEGQHQWDGRIPLVRQYRGTCQICGKVEQTYHCPVCKRTSCEGDWARRHWKCIGCSPKCTECRQVAWKTCGDCGGWRCTSHGKRLMSLRALFPWLCEACTAKRGAT